MVLVLSWLVPGAAAAPAGGLEVPEVVRLGGGSLGPLRVFESEPIRVRLGAAAGPRVVRLLWEIADERWRGAEVTFTATTLGRGSGLGGALLQGVPSPVLRAAPGAAAEAEIVLRIRAPARGLGAGPRALRLRWDAVVDPREPFAPPAGAPPGGPPAMDRAPAAPSLESPGLPRSPAFRPPAGPSPHSARSATIGSTRVAERAGR